MSGGALSFVLRLAGLLRPQSPVLEQAELRRYIQGVLDRRERFLAAAQQAATPLYVLDTESLITRARRFHETFARAFSGFHPYFAVKSNNHPLIGSALLGEGFGLDVSSGLELSAALTWGAHDVVFSGPGKTDRELALAVEHSREVTVLMDSFGELDRLERVAGARNTTVRAGVRVTVDESGIWRKFGVAPSQLGRFFEAALRCRYVKLRGLQFHLSWNLSYEPQVAFIQRLGEALERLTPRFRKQIEFVDLGGGFWPERGEWQQAAATPLGLLRTALGKPPAGALDHYKLAAIAIEDFAAHLSGAVRTSFPEDMRFAVFAEPGRWLCNDAMHILMKVMDRKAEDLVIVDGGINAVGWERYESDYCPLINLTRPGLRERECLVAGSLCTPHDVWGYGYFGEDIRDGDLILVPDQGAYTYSLRQEFIKPVPSCVALPPAQAADQVGDSGGETSLIDRSAS